MKIAVNGNQLRGDLVGLAVLRNDATPVPVTLEAEIIIIDEVTRKGLGQGKIIIAGDTEDRFSIVKSVRAVGKIMQGEHRQEVIKVTALLESCLPVSFVREKPVTKEKSTLADIYRACGAKLSAIDADFKADKFMCFVGEVPSFHIARVCQENGGVLRWKKGKMKFFRLPDLFKQKTVLRLPDGSSQDIDSGFSERHEIPSFYSIADDGTFVYGNRDKARSAQFIPQKKRTTIAQFNPLFGEA